MKFLRWLNVALMNKWFVFAVGWGGFLAIGFSSSWTAAVGVFLMLWANNVDNELHR